MFSENKNKMIFQSGHKEFDKQTNLIAIGDVISNTQISSYISPFNKVDNGTGTTYAKGFIQEFDLIRFTNLPPFVANAVKKYAVDEAVILYQFHHTNNVNHNRVIHGYVIVSTDDELLEKFVVGPTLKSQNVIEECIKYIALTNTYQRTRMMAV